tara:strand:- start:1344 stop:2693 length:1350 start_codon:yes stop_codon:yes gene_type:complete
MTSKALSLFILIAILFALIFNIIYYDPFDGYDAEAHYNYVDSFSRYLPRSINIPDDSQTREFFNPPLGYLTPSVGQVICRNYTVSSDYLSECRYFYGKFTQIIQSFIYLLTLCINLLTLKKFYNSKNFLNLEYLILVSLIAVNYRTISMIRGEPYILFFLSILFYKFSQYTKKSFEVSSKEIIFFGTIIGMLALSRQWAFLLFPAFFILIIFINEKTRKNYSLFLLKSFLVGFLLSSWFYFTLLFRYGSFTAFNKESIGFSFFNQPLNFYIPNLNDLYLLFTNPIRPNFSNQFISILYADTWGDYWGYFVFTSTKLDLGRNQDLIGSYLARVNLLNLPLTIFLISSIFLLKKTYKNNIFIKYINYSILFSLVGYLWFLISYPDFPTGDTNKATYILQIINMIVFLGSIYLKEIKEKNILFYRLFMIYLFTIFIHNFDSFLSHFPQSLNF